MRIAILLSLTMAACAASRPAQQPAPAPGGAQNTSQPAATRTSTDSSSTDRPQYASTYKRRPEQSVMIRNATIMTATGQEIPGASIVLRDGKIIAVGRDVAPPPDAEIIDGTGKFVTPGVIDTHSHIGVYAAPSTSAESDGNEATNPVTAEVWAEHSIWPQDPQIPLAIAAGVTTMQVLPGSANLVGGRGVTVKVIPGRTVQEIKFPGAPYGVKMACGENPKRVYASRGPSTRMGNMAGYRAAFIEAERYRRRWDTWLKDKKGDAPDRNLRNETLAGVLRGDILVQNHCYRADEMVLMLDLAREFGFKIRAFHHAVESYKIADHLAQAGTAVSVWADWWGFKEEAMDGILENAALNQQAGGRPVIHSDSPSGIQRLNQEAAKAMYAGIRAGIPITRDQALRWFTANAAWTLGIDSIVGTLEPGKMADVVLWSADPFSVYAKAVRVYNDGWLIYDRDDPKRQPRTDFELWQVPMPGSDR
jgi:imidazolonepropionase-like amidohydrolase